jgi:hypothetical protein
MTGLGASKVLTCLQFSFRLKSSEALHLERQEYSKAIRMKDKDSHLTYAHSKNAAQFPYIRSSQNEYRIEFVFHIITYSTKEFNAITENKHP